MGKNISSVERVEDKWTVKWIGGRKQTLAWYNILSTFSVKELFCQYKRTNKTRICFQFSMINILYMFRALIYSSSGGTVYTIIGMFCAIMLAGY
jgi:hypothetical protein